MNDRSIILGWQGEELLIPGEGLSITRQGLNIFVSALQVRHIMKYSIRLTSELAADLEFRLPGTTAFCLCQLKGATFLHPGVGAGFLFGQTHVLVIAHPDSHFRLKLKKDHPLELLLFTIDTGLEPVDLPFRRIRYLPFVPSLFLYSNLLAANAPGSGSISRPVVEQVRHVISAAYHEQWQAAAGDRSKLYTGSAMERILYELTAEMIMTLDIPMSISEICEQYHLSGAQLNFLFQSRLGVTYESFLRGLKLGRANRLLLNSKLTVEEIADQTGFAGVAQFSIAFRKKYGCTPIRLRKASGITVAGSSVIRRE